MKAKFFKNLFGGVLALALILVGCNFNASSFVYAENMVDYVNYVSFGDSIATGYGLDGYSASSDFIDGSYETLFKSYLQTNAGDVNALSYAVDGHTGANLLSILQNNNDAKESVQQADVITISIGGNDLLIPAKNNIVTCFLEGSYDTLKTALNSAVENFDNSMGFILSEINKLNPETKIFITNVFNPYKALMAATHGVTLHITEVPALGQMEVSVPVATLNEFGALTETYIVGDEGGGITGINQIIQKHASDYNNCYVVDAKSDFDSYNGEYTDVARASITTQEEINLTFNEVYSENKIFDYLDPHPTALGHQILANKFQSSFGDNLAMVKIDYNGGTLNNLVDDKYITVKNKTIQIPESPVFEHYTFVGWSTNKNTFEAYDFADDVISNLTLYANWQAITYTVKFDYNGGVLDDNTYAEVTVVEGMTVIAPSGDEVPTKEKFSLVGWYADALGEQEFDFNTKIEADTTIYAKWEQIAFDVTFNYNGGKVEGETSATIVVDKGQLVTEPNGENAPTLLDHMLIGWYADQDLQDAWDFANDTVTEDITLYAKWECTVWYITLDFNGGTANGVGSQTIKVAKGNKLQMPGFEPSKAGYVFMYWYLTDENVEFDFANTEINSNLTLLARWQQGINVVLHYGDIQNRVQMPVGSCVGDMDIPKRDGTVFFGWFKDDLFIQEFESDEMLYEGLSLYIKWINLICENESLLIQEFSPISKNIDWHINARAGSVISWQVNGQEVDHGTGEVKGNEGAAWSFIPANYGVGTYVITCLVDGGVVNGRTIQLKYSTPSDVLINLHTVIDKKTYVLEIDNQQYYDSSKFIWYKTSDPYSDDFAEEIGRGFKLTYTFDNDCKVCVKYCENEYDVGLMSNIIDVSVDNHIDTVTMVAIIITIVVIAVIVVSAVVSYRKNKGMN